MYLSADNLFSIFFSSLRVLFSWLAQNCFPIVIYNEISFRSTDGLVVGFPWAGITKYLEYGHALLISSYIVASNNRQPNSDLTDQMGKI